MNKPFLEFWKNAFTNAAKGIQQFEAFTQWMDQGMRGVQEISDQFRKAYGLDRLPETSEETQRLWDKAMKDFQDSYRAFIDGMGMVPKEKYAAVVKKCEALETIVSEQKQQISRLRLRVHAEETEEDMKGLARLMENQAIQFQKTMDAMGTFLGKGKTKRKE